MKDDGREYGNDGLFSGGSYVRGWEGENGFGNDGSTGGGAYVRNWAGGHGFGNGCQIWFIITGFCWIGIA